MSRPAHTARMLRLLLLSGASLCVLCGAASAEIITGTFSGTVSGTDGDGLFGAPGATYTNAPITGTIAYSTTGYQNFDIGTPGNIEAVSFGVPGLVTITETVNGYTHVSSDTYFNEVEYVFDNSNPQYVGDYNAESISNSSAYSQQLQGAYTTNDNIQFGGNPPTLALTQSTGIVQNFSLSGAGIGTGTISVATFVEPGQLEYTTDLSLTLDQLSVPGDEVPEPGGMAMLLTGLGAMTWARRTHARRSAGVAEGGVADPA